MNTFSDLFGKKLLLFDGAMGTMLQRAGLRPGELPERKNMDDPDLIIGIHKAYLDAGCDVITTNTFGANPLKLANTAEVVSTACALANRAKALCGHGYTALDLGPLGRLIEPVGDLDFEDAVSAYAEVVRAGAPHADLILIETMNDTMEIKAAVLAAKENASLPILVSVTFDEDGRLLTGADLPAVVALLEGLDVDGIGLNCAHGPATMLAFLPRLLATSSTPLFISPNAGLPEVVDGVVSYHVPPEEFAAALCELVKAGAAAVGGCCGTTPEHMQAASEALAALAGYPLPLSKKNLTVVSSYSSAVCFSDAPLILGERINPTGKSKFKEALRSGDMEYILREAIAEQNAGAHILDVNVGLPEIDECAVLTRAVREIQSICPLPLMIDTSDPAAMESALRRYNGKALINSVSGKRESMEAIFPLMKKYGGVAVALTLDENGIPETAEGRIAIAERIVATAAAYGIDKKDLVFDTLTLTVSTDQANADRTLDALTHIRRHMGIHTVLGVSNISFGLPCRDEINAAFFTLAMEKGLSGGIINPLSERMMSAYRAYRALKGYDTGFAEYLAHFASAPAAKPTAQSALSLAEAIRRGLTEDAAARARELLVTDDPLAIINDEIVPALDEVGRGFEAKTLFLPQLLMSADAAKAAFSVLREAMSSANTPRTKHKIVLATVKGDIHDIGKNIVHVMLENYGYEILDLGKDVPPEAVVDAVLENEVTLVGLSALMTTTVPAMEEIIRLLREKAPHCRVMVGGAVLTEDYAAAIGADRYAADAMGSVKIAKEFFGE